MNVCLMSTARERGRAIVPPRPHDRSPMNPPVAECRDLLWSQLISSAAVELVPFRTVVFSVLAGAMRIPATAPRKPAVPPPPPTPSNAASSTLAAPSTTEATPTPSGSTGAPNHAPYAQPPSPTPPSRGEQADASASIRLKVRVDLAA